MSDLNREQSAEDIAHDGPDPDEARAKHPEQEHPEQEAHGGSRAPGIVDAVGRPTDDPRSAE
jgi:hypothetical protein